MGGSNNDKKHIENNVTNTEWDVIIVGSGLSGLTAAYRLLQANPGLRVLIVDSLDGFGGRTKSIALPQYNAKVSVGGTFSLFEHHDTLNLAAEVGCSPEVPLPITAANLALFSPDLVGLVNTPLGLPLFFELMWKGAKVVNGGQIMWDCPTAKKLDSMSLETWINNQSLLKYLNPNFTREFFYLLETYPDLATVSALQCAVALYVRFRGIPRNGFEIPPQTLRWEGGTGVFTEALVDLLRAYGPDHFGLMLNSPVVKISQPPVDLPPSSGAHPVEVTVNENWSKPVVMRAKYVIVATSPLASAPKSRGGNIDYAPALPADASTLFSATNATPTVSINILVIYKRPWWRQYGGVMILPEYSRHVHEKGVWGNVVDGSMSGDDVTGIVRIFCDSRRVENWPEAEIKAGALGFLKKLFPSDEQARLIDDYVEIMVWDWNRAKPCLPGVTFTFPPSGVLSTHGHAMTRPHGRIHWGGSERSVWGSGWMEGAVERGNDVAQEVLLAAGWAPFGYDVRHAPSAPKGLRAPSSLSASSSFFGLSNDPASDDELSGDDNDDYFNSDSELDELSGEWTVLTPRAAKTPRSPRSAAPAQTTQSGAARSFVPRTRLDLAAHLFTDEQRRTMNHKQQLAHLASVEPPKDSASRYWISPQHCLAALKEINDIKVKRSGVAAACASGGLFSCPAGSSSTPSTEKESGCVLC